MPQGQGLASPRRQAGSHRCVDFEILRACLHPVMKATIREVCVHRGVGCKGLIVLNEQLLSILEVAGGESGYWNFNSSQAVRTTACEAFY